MSTPSRRIAYAIVAALVALAAPLLLWWFLAPRAEDKWLIALIAVPFLGPLVFELLSRPRPRWGHGVVFALVMAVICGLYSGVILRLEQSGPGAATFVGALMFILALIAGLAGAFVAWLIGWSLGRESRTQTRRRLQPWHAGVALALADVVAVAVVAAIAA